MIGLLPGLGTTLGSLEASGQLDRCRLEWRAYARAFGGARWFGYGSETAVFTVSGADGASRTNDRPPPGCAWLEALPKPRWAGARAWALLMPLLQPELRRCRVLRVLNLTGVIPALIAQDTPYILQVGYDAPAVARAHGKPLRAWCLRQLQDLAVQRATGVIYATTALWEVDYRRGLHKPGRDTVIPNGVDLEHFRPLWRCPPGKSQRRVVYVGRLSPEKNLDLLAAACRRIGATLHLFGAGPLAAQLSALPGVTTYGPVPHYSLPKILASFDAFCLSSATEGSPKALLEALAVGVPSVAARGLLECGSPWPPHPLDGRDERWSHCWFNPGDVDDLTATLASVLDDPTVAATFSRGGRRWIEARHDLRKTLQDEIAFVHNAVEGAYAEQTRQA